MQILCLFIFNNNKKIKMKTLVKNYFYFLGLIILLNACSMAKNIPYFKNLESSSDNIAVNQHEARICNDDLLTITVSAEDPLAVSPFNLPIVSYSAPGSESLYTSPVMQPYLVDINGEITFPVLGKIKVGGLKKSEAVELIKEKLKPYLKDPIVVIQYRNFKITVLGEVTRPGSYTISNERISIIEALGLAGDMTVYGKRDNVLLIRESDNGKKEYVRINLNNTDILSSPYYYLQQNDVIYVEPNSTKVTAASNANLSLYLSTISTLASVATTIVAILNMK